MVCQSANVFRQPLPKNMHHNCKGAMNFHLNPWVLTGNDLL